MGFSSLLLAGKLLTGEAEAAEPAMTLPSAKDALGQCEIVQGSHLTYRQVPGVVAGMNEKLGQILGEQYSKKETEEAYARSLVVALEVGNLGAQIERQSTIIDKERDREAGSQSDTDAGREVIADARKVVGQLTSVENVLVDGSGTPRKLKDIGYDQTAVEDAIRYDAAMSLALETKQASGLDCTAPLTDMFVHRYTFPTPPAQAYGADLNTFTPHMMSVEVKEADPRNFETPEATILKEGRAYLMNELTLADNAVANAASRLAGIAAFEKQWHVDLSKGAAFPIKVNVVKAEVPVVPVAAPVEATPAPVAVPVAAPVVAPVSAPEPVVCPTPAESVETDSGDTLDLDLDDSEDLNPKATPNDLEPTPDLDFDLE